MTQQNESTGDDQAPLLWGELADLCWSVHRRFHEDGERAEALSRVPDLKRILAALPDRHRDVAIVYWDASALVAELEGRLDEAADCRRREIELTETLHQSFEDGIDLEDVCGGRDTRYLEERRGILSDLLRKCGRDS